MVNRDDVSLPALVIAGTDPSGAAGMAADLRAFAAFGIEAGAVVTAVTAQSLRHFKASYPVPVEQLRAQLMALADMPAPRVIKIGMLGSAANAQATCEWLASQPGFVVLDPVLRSTTGGCLADDEVVTVIAKLLPQCSLITPNIPEAERLSGRTIHGPADMPAAAAALRAMGAKRVLIKGGHLSESAAAHDYFDDGEQRFWLSSPRRVKTRRGTGCTFASAVAAGVGAGLDLPDALTRAKIHGNARLRRPAPVDADGIVENTGDFLPEDLPVVSTDLESVGRSVVFAGCGAEPLGFYPIVDRSAWVRRLVGLGVRTLQLRIKDLSGTELEREVRAAVAAAGDARLFINDHWRLAIACGAYGVHLGQEDLLEQGAEALPALQHHGLRLGISTHSFYELAVAHGINPSYIALGPILATTCKSMRFGPQGFARLRLWRSLWRGPLVAIGGMKVEHLPEAVAAGANGVAAIADVIHASDPDARVREWLRHFEHQSERPT